MAGANPIIGKPQPPDPQRDSTLTHESQSLPSNPRCSHQHGRLSRVRCLMMIVDFTVVCDGRSNHSLTASYLYEHRFYSQG
jgi:hypothetical protein